MGSAPFVVKPFDEAHFNVHVVGLPPGLLTNAISPEAKENLILGSEGRKPKAVPPLTREEQFMASLYHLPGNTGFGIKSDAFLQAMVRAAMSLGKLGSKSAKKLNGKQVKALVAVGTGPDDLIPIDGTPEARHDLISNAQGSKSAVTRGWFREWEATLVLRFPPELVDGETVLQLLSDAGQAVGIGSWRRENGGHFGRFVVAEVAKQ
jgi:hypothetical protein